MLPKAVRDELKMCVTLRDYSSIRGGFGMKLDYQYKKIESFYHGTKTQPSQINLLAESQLSCAALHNRKIAIVVLKKSKSKKNKETPVQYYLKSSLARIDNKQFFQHINITAPDLERKLRHYSLHPHALTQMFRKEF